MFLNCFMWIFKHFKLLSLLLTNPSSNYTYSYSILHLLSWMKRGEECQGVRCCCSLVAIVASEHQFNIIVVVLVLVPVGFPVPSKHL